MFSAKNLLPTRSDLLRSNDEYFHVYNRGVDRQLVFFSNEYYTLFTSLMDEAVKIGELKILAYCLMPNHFHLLVHQIKAFGLSYFMEKVCGEYAKVVNQIRERKGHLFQGRYRLRCVHSPDTLPVVANYVHLNPVSAGLVRMPEEWEYGSCREYLGLRTSTFVSPEEVLANLNGTENYRAYLTREGAGLFLPRQLRFAE